MGRYGVCVSHTRCLLWRRQVGVAPLTCHGELYKELKKEGKFTEE